MPRSERLARLVTFVETSQAELELAETILEMDVLLGEVGLELDGDLSVDEYLATVEHLALFVDGDAEETDLGLTEAADLREGMIKKGFKMVFGRLVKAGKRLLHRGMAKYNNFRANQAATVAAKYKARAKSHSAKAAAHKRRPTAAGTRARKAAGKKPAVRAHRRPMKKRTMRREDVESSPANEGIRDGFKMVFGKLVKLKNLLKTKKSSSDTDAYTHNQRQAHSDLRTRTASLRRASAGSRAARDRYLSQAINPVVDALVEMFAEAGYDMTPPEDATLADYIINIGAFIEDPESDLDEAARAGMRMVFGKLRRTGIRAKLPGKYKRFRRERTGATSRGGSWSGKESVEEAIPEPDAYSLPAFYELVKHASDQQIWFKATSEMKKPGYKGLQVVWWAGDRKPKKAKQSSIQRIDIDQGSYVRVKKDSLPPEVLARFEES